jgi:hypothetical protein
MVQYMAMEEMMLQSWTSNERNRSVYGIEFGQIYAIKTVDAMGKKNLVSIDECTHSQELYKRSLSTNHHTLWIGGKYFCKLPVREGQKS